MDTLKELSFQHFRGTGKHSFSKPGVIFTGENGSGKSTRLDTVRLALMGHLPEQGKQASTMMQNATMDGMGVSLSLYLDSSEHSITRWYEGSIKSAKAECKIEPDGITGKECEYWISQNLKIHPLLLNNDFFRLSEPEQQKTFLSICKPTWTIEMVNLELEKKRIDPISGLVPERELIALMTRIRKMVTDGQADIRSQKSHIKKLTERLAEFSELTGNVADKKLRRDQLQTDLQNVTTQIARIEKTPEYQQALQDNQDALQAIITKRDKEEAELGVHRSELPIANQVLADMNADTELKDELQRAKTRLGMMTVFDLLKPESIPTGTDCLACGTTITDQTIIGLKAKRAKNVLARKRLENQITELEAATLEKEKRRLEQNGIISAIESGIRVLEKDIERFNTSISDLESTIKKQEAYLAVELPELSALQSQRDAMTAEIKTLNDDIENLQRQKEVMVSIDEARQEIEEKETLLPLWNENVKDIRELLDKIILESKKAFLEPAQRFLDEFQDIGKADIILMDEETGKECFKYGCRQSAGVKGVSTFIPFAALSTGERKIYETAFLVAVIANTGNRFPLLIVDNLHDLDSSRIIHYLTAIEGLLQSGTIVNFIGASTNPVQYEGSEWIEVVNLDAGKEGF